MTQRSIVLASLKGGVSKTSVALNLAACWAQAGERVLLVDADPNRSASRFHARGGSALLGDAGRCVGVEEAETAAAGFDRLILDTAGGIAAQQVHYATGSSFVVVPTLATMAALELVVALAPLIRSTGVPFAALLTQVDERRKGDELAARQALRSSGVDVLKSRTTFVSAWVKAEASGVAVGQAQTDSGRPDPKARRAWLEIKTLASEIDSLIN